MGSNSRALTSVFIVGFIERQRTLAPHNFLLSLDKRHPGASPIGADRRTLLKDGPDLRLRGNAEDAETE